MDDVQKTENCVVKRRLPLRWVLKVVNNVNLCLSERWFKESYSWCYLETVKISYGRLEPGIWSEWCAFQPLNRSCKFGFICISLEVPWDEFINRVWNRYIYYICTMSSAKPACGTTWVSIKLFTSVWIRFVSKMAKPNANVFQV